MPHGTKIATCCYCGTRAALVLKGETRHELACSACGAPLHDLKMLRADATRDHPMALSGAAGPARPKRREDKRIGAATPRAIWEREKRSNPRKHKKKKRKSLAKRFFEEAFDVIEDIFD